jgi:hypothetical protein
MRYFLILLILSTAHWADGQIRDTLKIRVDGFYQTKAEFDKQDKDTTCHYLRFYPTGKVISVPSEGGIYDLKSWFNLHNAYISIGNYIVRRNKLYFSTTQGTTTVTYKGKLKNPYCLVLKWKSLSNGNKGREKYYFVAIPDLE